MLNLNIGTINTLLVSLEGDIKTRLSCTLGTESQGSTGIYCRHEPDKAVGSDSVVSLLSVFFLSVGNLNFEISAVNYSKSNNSTCGLRLWEKRECFLAFRMVWFSVDLFTVAQ